MKIVFFVLLTVFFGLAGCGHSSSGGLQDDSIPGSEFISAAAGLEVSFAEQGGRLSVPSGAVSEDTPYSISVSQVTGLPDASRLASLVFEFSPSDLSLSKLATITLPISGTTAANDSFYIAKLVDGQWQNTASSSRVGRVVSTSISGSMRFYAVNSVWQIKPLAPNVSPVTQSRRCGLFTSPTYTLVLAIKSSCIVV